MMRRLLTAAIFAAALLAGGAFAQTFPPPQLPAFHHTGQATLAVTATTGNVALATNGASSPVATTVVITNTGAKPAFVKLGVGNTTTATVANGYPLVPNVPNVPVALVVGANTYLAAICGGADSTSLSISTGY